MRRVVLKMMMLFVVYNRLGDGKKIYYDNFSEKDLSAVWGRSTRSKVQLETEKASGAFILEIIIGKRCGRAYIWEGDWRLRLE